MDQIDQWRLIEKAGMGGLADVWKAEPMEGGTVRALKVLRDPSRSVAHKARFLREGRLLERLSHSGLPACYGSVDGDQPYLILDYLEGETLSHRIRRGGPLSPEAVATVATSLLRALSYLHDRGIVHRDVKASNVFLTDDRRVLLLDLGLAADPADPLTTTLGDVMGTYAYMAPEQIAGAEVDHRCDLYSAGVTLYESLAGARPFVARGAAGYLRAHRAGNAPPLAERCPEAPTRLVDTITRLMARDPAGRPHSATVAQAMLSGAAGTRRSLNRPRLVGRAAAIGAVQAVLDGGGHLAVLGEIGSGTGRLASTALAIARHEGCEAIAIRCQGRALPHDPIEQLARDLSRISGRVPPTVPELSRELAESAGEGPLLVVIEDAEHCSVDAAAALSKVITAAPGISVVITGARNPLEIDAHVVELRTLSREEVHRLVCHMLGSAAPPAGLAHRLHKMSGGLPALVVLAIKELVSRGALWCSGVSDEGESVWRLDRAVPLEPTTGLARLFGEVLTSLPPAGREVMEILSVAGESLPKDVAVALGGADDTGETVGALTKAGLVSTEYHRDDEWLVLRRPAVGTLVLGQVTELRQSDIHRALAGAYAQLAPSEWRDQRVAWHKAHGAPPERAASALYLLGEDLYRRGQGNQALEVLGRAARSPHLNNTTAARLAVLRGEALESVGRRTEAVDALSAGRRLADDMGDTSLKARALVCQARVYQGLGDEERTETLAAEALALIEKTPDDPSMPAALLLAANGHRLGARGEQAAALYHRCIDAAMELGQREYAAMAHGELGAMLAEEGHLEDAARHLRQEATFLRTRSMPQRLVNTLCRMGMVNRRMGQVDRALEALDEADEVARFAELPYDRAITQVSRASVHISMGDLRSASSLLRGARVALDVEAAAWVRLAYREVQAEARMVAGDRQAALAAFQAAQADAAKSGFAALGAYFLGMVGVLTADPDALTDAMDVLGRGGDRRLAARLLFYGATVGGDAEVLKSAETEARASGDRFLLLDVLHASGGPQDREEARKLARHIYSNAPRNLRPQFRSLPAVRWSGLGSAARRQTR